MNYCETCRFRNTKGNCVSDKVSEDYWCDSPKKDDMLLYSYTEGGEFWVGPKFGCVHHETSKEHA